MAERTLLEDVLDQRQVAQQTRPAVALHDFLGRTAEVQVDQIEAEVLHHAGGVRKRRGVAAKQLRRNRVFVAIKREVLFGFLVLVPDDAVSRGELGHHEAAAAQVTDEPAEDRVGDASHRRQDRRRTDFDSADGHRRRDAHTRRRHPLGRIVEVLVHSTIVNEGRIPFEAAEKSAKR